jgi:glutaredoxin-like protein
VTVLLGREDRAEIERIFRSGLAGEVKAYLFTSVKDREFCDETRLLLEEVASLTDRVTLQVIDKDEEGGMAKAMAVDACPTTVIVASNGARLHYVGMPAGRQLRSLADDFVDASRGRSEMEEEARSAINRVTEPTVIRVFVTPVCPYSPLVVRSAHMFAIENPLIKAYMVEILEFPVLAKKYGVVGVPRTIINGTVMFDGAPNQKAFAEMVLDASRRPAPEL